MSSSDSKKKMTDEEKRQIDLQRRDFFKGTIAIIVIYGVFILGISLIGMFSEGGRELLFVNGFPFTVTFISGTILIIILLLIQIFTYDNTPPPAKLAGEQLSCPDYWVLKETPKDQLNKIVDPQVKQLSKYYCENPANTATLKSDISLASVVVGEETRLTKLRDISQKYNYTTPDANKLSQQYHMQCNRLYPDYMTYMDKTNFKDDPTTIRCEYLKQCKSDSNSNNVISWTSVCPIVPQATITSPSTS